MRNRRTLEALHKLQRSAEDPAASGRMIAIIENELGYRLYDAVGKLKRALSNVAQAEFKFEGGGVKIGTNVRREQFEGWIAPDLARIEATVDRALAASGVSEGAVDRVFLTGGSSLIPAVRDIFVRRFGEARIGAGGELTSIAHGLAMVAQEDDVAAWAG